MNLGSRNAQPFAGNRCCPFPSQAIVTLFQQNYKLDLAAKFNFPTELKPTTSIRADYYKLLEALKAEPVLEVPYKELVGSLNFNITCTHADIAFAVSSLTQYFSAPRALHSE